jgi:peptide deformylase
MSVLPILTWPDPRLSQRCEPVVHAPGLAGVIADLFETMYAAQGRGLAAPQVGILQQFFVMDCGWKEGTPTPKVCINPTILKSSDETATRPEACLSLPGISADIIRPACISLQSYDLAGQKQLWQLDGFQATCAQQEFDHLQGLVTFDRLDPADRLQLEARYSAVTA